jgi:hypothetical protein
MLDNFRSEFEAIVAPEGSADDTFLASEEVGVTGRSRSRGNHF